MQTAGEQLVQARRLIAKLSLACRRTDAYLSGISSMDEQRVRRMLREVIRESEKFMET